MKKLKKLNNQGYMLIETLLVSVFILSIFTLLYTNIFPLVGDYDRYKDYNSVESTYISHWVRKFAHTGIPDNIYQMAASSGYVDITDCNLFSQNNMNSWCSGIKVSANISKIFLTSYQTTEFKNYVRNNNFFSRSFKEYIAYLPSYAKNTAKTAAKGYYRVIVEYEVADKKHYGTMEVRR